MQGGQTPPSQCQALLLPGCSPPPSPSRASKAPGSRDVQGGVGPGESQRPVCLVHQAGSPSLAGLGEPPAPTTPFLEALRAQAHLRPGRHSSSFQVSGNRPQRGSHPPRHGTDQASGHISPSVAGSLGACACVRVCVRGGGGFSRARSAPQFRPPCHPRPVPHNCLALDSPLPLPPGPGGRSPGHPRLASSGRPEEQVPGTGRGESAAPAQRRPTWVRAGSSLRPRPSSGPALPSSGRLAAEGGGGSGQPEPDATGRARRAGTGRAGGGPRFRAGGGRGPERAQPEQTAGDRSRQASSPRTAA